MNELKRDITKTMKAFKRYKVKTEKTFQKLCKNVNMTPPLTNDDNDLISLLLPFFDSQAFYYADNCHEGLYEFHTVSNEDSIHNMLCMLNHPDYEWVCDDDCERSTNGLMVLWKLEKTSSHSHV
jgi:hypothetical protein